ncbi:MAG: hypothetical protein KDK01_12000 [Rhodobacteraceae bacterium]|nr:hypothetical protein [Paracoccaceae bacterium]
MPSEGGGALRRLGVALLNATLLLAALVLLLAVILVWQVRGLATDMRDGLRSELVTIQPRVEEARHSAQEALSALDAAAQAPGATTSPPPVAVTQAQDRLRALLDDLATLDPGLENAEQTESLLRRLALLIIATAAQGLLDPAAR